MRPGGEVGSSRHQGRVSRDGRQIDPGSADPLDADHSFDTPDDSDGREEVLCHTADDGKAQDLVRDSRYSEHRPLRRGKLVL